jgi:uncharacterized protein
VIATNPSPLAREFRETGRSESCPVIDMHGHYGPFQGIYFPSSTAEDMIGTMDRAGVSMIVCSSHHSLIDSQAGNERMAEVVRQNPGRISAYWCINPNDPALIEKQLAEISGKPEFVGFKFLSDYHKYPITGENYAPAIEYAQEHRMPILMHTWGGSSFDGPKLVDEVAKRFPDVTILMGHSGFGEWDVAIDVASRHPNVYLELTAAYAVNRAIEMMVDGAGSHKVLYGTDLPWFDPHYAIGCILYARITDEDRRNILHRNAEKILSRTEKSSFEA